MGGGPDARQTCPGEPLLPFAAVSGDGAWSPLIDVREHPAEYTVVADLPGVEPTTVEVTADGDLLTITGARRDDPRLADYLLRRPSTSALRLLDDVSVGGERHRGRVHRLAGIARACRENRDTLSTT